MQAVATEKARTVDSEDSTNEKLRNCYFNAFDPPWISG